jgi:uncharacterized Zn finger protein
MYYGWRPYVSVGERKRRAAREVEKLRKKGGRPASPVIVEGRTLATTFWGKAWCDNLERYSDFENRLPRGRSYLRNGLVVDLDIAEGKVNALVSGSRIYKVVVNVTPVTKARWRSICQDCAGGIDSLVELLQGRFSKGVMERVCLQKKGLFPSPDEIEFSCSCPDWASMCKHVAAVLYGIGARLDKQPELLFKLHQVDQHELIVKAGTGFPPTRKQANRERILGRDDLSELFGLELVRDTTTNASLSGTRARPRNAKTRAGEKNKKDRDVRKESDPKSAATTPPAVPDRALARRRKKLA